MSDEAIGEDQGRPRVQSAARTVEVLLAIARSARGLRAKEVAEGVGLPRQVAYHLLHTMSATRIIRKNDQNRFVLGRAASVVAEGFRRQLTPPEHLAPAVRAIAASTGETAYASGWLDGEIVVMATARGNAPVQAAEVPMGFSEDAHARASGKLLLALAEPELAEVYLSRRPLARRTRNTLTSKGEIAEAFARIRAEGYATEEEEFAEGLCCMAVPAEGAAGAMVFGISVPAERFHARREDYLKLLREAAALQE